MLTLVQGQVKLDGSGSDSPNMDGLPSSLSVSLMGTFFFFIITLKPRVE